jgi:UDP-glucose 4-epimerase
MGLQLVTGGAGFIGSHLVADLLTGGQSVRVLDNFSTGRAENLAGFEGNLEILEGDLREPHTVRRAVQDVSVVYHQAAFVSVPGSMQDPQTCFDVNVGGTAGLLEAARQAGVRRVVLASSAAVYGDLHDLPLREDGPTRPSSPYAASKQAGEVYAGMYARLGLPVVALRYFNVFGPRQSPDSNYAAAVPIFIRRMLAGRPVTIFGDGRQSRDFISVHDVVQANLLAAALPASDEYIFNVCTGQETSLLDLLAVLDGLFPDNPPPEFTAPRPGDIYRSIGAPDRAERLLGFRAGVNLAAGLEETVAWMRR